MKQLTFLLFLKMADERARLTGEAQPIPKGCRWEDLSAPRMEGVALEQHYGVEIVPGVSRPDGEGRAPPVRTDGALRAEPSAHAGVVLTNPPSGSAPTPTTTSWPATR